MPCWELFEAQDDAYKNSVLPAEVTRRVSIEAGATLGWERYLGADGIAIGVDRFGASRTLQTDLPSERLDARPCRRRRQRAPGRLTTREPSMPEATPRVIVVLPTYNERENIVRVVPALFSLGIPDLRLLIVDDNSPDGTGRVADELAASDQYDGRLHVLHRAQKQGLGPAYIEGFKRALALKADLVIQMDADLSHQPKYLPRLLERAREHDIVIGSRYAPGGSVDEGWGPLRKLLSWWANRIYTPAILRLPIRDATGGYRVYRRGCLIGLDLDMIKANGYVFMVELAYVANRLGYSIGEIPIHFPDRQHGDSKMSWRVAGEAALRVWQIVLRHHALRPADRRTTPYERGA